MRLDAARLITVAAAMLALAACGSTATLPEAPSGGALTTSSVGFRQTGSGAATIDQSSVTYKLDDSGSLVIHLSLTSTSSTAQTIDVRASLFDANGGVVGDAQGAAIAVQPGAVASVQLNGMAPTGTIASGTFEVTTQASPTPTT